MTSKNIAVLIVDDAMTDRRIIRAMLKEFGFRNVEEASDGTDALVKLRAKPYDFIISDWHMAPMNGLELLKQIRADSQLKAIPFLMVTSEQKPENVMAAREQGVSNYIVKPFTTDKLKAKVISVLGPF